MRALIQRLDRQISLEPKLIIAVLVIAVGAAVVTGVLLLRLLDQIRDSGRGGSAAAFERGIDAATRDVIVMLAVVVGLSLAAFSVVLYWLVLRRTERISRTAFRAGAGDAPGGREPGRDVLATVVHEIDEMVASLQARTRQQAAVAELSQHALAGAEVPSLLDEAARLVAKGLGAQYGSVLEATAEGLIVRAGFGWSEGVIGECVPLRSQAGFTVRSDEPVLVEDLRDESRFPVTPILKRHGARSGASVSIPGSGGPFGVLATHDTRPRTFTPDDLHFLRSLANTLGSALRQREAERRLRDTEASFRNLVERVPAVTYTAGFGRQGVWQYVSPQVESLLGFRPQEFTSDPELWWRRVHPEDRDRVVTEEEQDRDRASRGPITSEYRMLARDGRVVWVRDEAVVVRDRSGRPLYYQGVMTDITERKEAEQALRAAYDREREAAERLRSLDEMKNTFLTAVSHELRTPLASVLGYALTLEQEEVRLPPDERAAMLGRLAANARKLDRFLGDLLDVDRLSRGIVEPRRQAVDVGELVRRLAEDIDMNGRSVHVEVEPAVAEVDGPKVERIVENLLANVARHTPPDATVWVRVTDEPDGVMITVEDAGPGVPDDLKSRVFEPFETGATPAYAPGTGIGLSLVARFTELHGGRVWVQDRAGGGASFRVFLPRTAAPTGTVAAS